MIIKFTEEEFDMFKKLMALFNIDVSIFGGLSREKLTLGINPKNSVEMSNEFASKLNEMGATKRAAFSKIIIDVLKKHCKNAFKAK